MTQAADIMHASADAQAATKAAELETDLVEHEHDATLFTFDDDSVLVVKDEQMSVFDDIAIALKSLVP